MTQRASDGGRRSSDVATNGDDGDETLGDDGAGGDRRPQVEVNSLCALQTVTQIILRHPYHHQ